ncbi:hypothetical protein CONCODRAFT_18265 [Conidiobolus coronatus NRRL 28638]|uniref:Ribosomal protein S36, mitochondrial n=1 Tax=Conidiobolus coronatus (strain ATCC 28846 / CBS 209.66 / NRRL 28638) TaxID=796925 RepID=A0A137P391_CONC2|nr:hypothetical protein CONCODRAFT_18265 [Conidiobolus coronatus NRRL 28638]|eukprot:KXN69490.1 hypothetical protein CONCODRAFT_18265 [Conidiobolus coronatus NRRL 28638]
MQLNKILLASAKSAPHRHTPLIKFLGKRSLLHNNEAQGQSASANKASEPQAKAQPSVGPFNTKLVYLEDAELPARFKRVHPTQYESDVIELGGAY